MLKNLGRKSAKKRNFRKIDGFAGAKASGFAQFSSYHLVNW